MERYRIVEGVGLYDLTFTVVEWQPTQHPIGIHSYEFWKLKLDYLYHNPCRKGLVGLPEDWRFSSARYWLTGQQGGVQLSDVGWE